MIRTLLITAVAVTLQAQVTSLMPPPVVQFFDDNGNPLAGGRICTYAAGTSTPLATYTDSTGGTSNGTSVLLGANGEAVNNIWLSPVAYKIVVRASGGDGTCGAGGGTIRKTVDNVYDWGQLLKADLANTSDVSKGDALVGVKQPATGSIARTQHAKNADTYGSRDFAVCDGSTSDTTTLQSALTAAAGKSLYVVGTCVGQGWTVPADTEVICQGGAGFKKNANGLLFTLPNDNVRISGCTFDGSGGTGDVVSITGDYITISKPTLKNASAYGFLMSGTTGTKIIDGTFLSTNTLAPIVATTSNDRGTISNNTIDMSGCDLTSVHCDGIELSATGGTGILQNFTVTGNTVLLPSTWAAPPGGPIGIEFWRAGGSTDIVRNMTLTGNNVKSTAGIVFAGYSIIGNGHTVTGNVASLNAAYFGLELVYFNGGTVAGNEFYITASNATGTTAISANNTNNTTISGNTIEAQINGTTTGYAIRVYADAQFSETPNAFGNQISGNRIRLLAGSSNAVRAVSIFCNDVAGQCSGNSVMGNTITGISNADGHVCLSINPVVGATVDGTVFSNNYCRNIQYGIDRNSVAINGRFLNNQWNSVGTKYNGTAGTGDYIWDATDNSNYLPTVFLGTSVAAPNLYVNSVGLAIGSTAYSNNSRLTEWRMAASAAYSAGAIGAGSFKQQQVGITGCAVGDLALAGATGITTIGTYDITATAIADQVVVTIRNLTAGSLTPTGNLKVSCIKTNQ